MIDVLGRVLTQVQDVLATATVALSAGGSRSVEARRSMAMCRPGWMSGRRWCWRRSGW